MVASGLRSLVSRLFSSSTTCLLKSVGIVSPCSPLVESKMNRESVAEMVLAFFSGSCIGHDLKSGKNSSAHKMDSLVDVLRILQSLGPSVACEAERIRSLRCKCQACDSPHFLLFERFCEDQFTKT